MMRSLLSSRSSITVALTRSFHSSRLVSAEGEYSKLACIGTGKMAQAILEPLVAKGVQPADKVHVYDVATDMLTKVSKDLGVVPSRSLPEAVQGADMIICAVKPQNLTEAFYGQIREGLMTDSGSKRPVFLSVIAGTPIDSFANNLVADNGDTLVTKIVRSMPNTPAQVGQGMTVWSCTDALTADDRQSIQRVLEACGNSMYVDSEDFIDMSTSISGSGPAYIFLLMESLIDGAVHMGFPREKATELVYQTMLGSTLYAMETGEHPAILRNRVTSPSGTTASALYELENGKMRTVIKDAMWACYRRSLEMGQLDSNVGPGRRVSPPAQSTASDRSDSDDDNQGGFRQR